MDANSMDAFAREWPRQRERWHRLAVWERERLRELPQDLAAALAWMSEAWDLALRHDPSWGGSEGDRERWERHAETRRRLARARQVP